MSRYVALQLLPDKVSKDKQGPKQVLPVIPARSQ